MKLKPWQYWVTKPLITVLFHLIGTQCEEMKWHTTAYPVFCAPVSFWWAAFQTDRRVQTFSLFQWRWRQVRKTSSNRFKTNSTYSNKVSEFHFSFFTISSDKANFLRNKATPTWTLSKPCESFSYAILPVVLTFNKRSHIAHGFDTKLVLNTKLVLKTRFQQQQQLNFSLPLYNDLIDKSQNSGNFCLPEMSLQ